MFADLNRDDAAGIKASIFSVSVKIWIAGLVRKNAGLADPIVMRSVIVPVDPKLGLKFFNHVPEIGDEGRRKGASLVSRLNRVRMRRVVRNDHGWPAEGRREFLPDEGKIEPVFCRCMPGHEPTVVPIILPVSYAPAARTTGDSLVAPR